MYEKKITEMPQIIQMSKLNQLRDNRKLKSNQINPRLIQSNHKSKFINQSNKSCIIQKSYIILLINFLFYKFMHNRLVLLKIAKNLSTKQNIELSNFTISLI
ncbi:unnamed protein product [Paramecium sonneborni]|uniref:Uncharacterized protein n=1 Tax=Paramecium sonneborni TaxID=65129 RepID=A0A8S1RTT6_9CILI|nr:unnamed protein product [Paramecium sonneborni]